MTKLSLNRLYKIIRDSGITVVWDDSPTACLCLNEELGYIIRIPRKLRDMGQDEHKAILLHELAHLLHGDLLAPQNQENATLWNRACDARINRAALVAPLFKVLCRLYPPTPDGRISIPVTYKILCARIPELPTDTIPPASVIYEILKKHRGDDGEDGRERPRTHDDLQPAEGNPEVLRRRHAEALVKLRKALKSDPELEKLIGSGGHIAARKRKTVTFDPAPLAKIDAILSRLDGIDGRRQFSRTWIRPRRLGENTTLRGGAYLPRPKLLVIVDVSGSRAERLDLSQALVDACRDRFEAETIVHDVEAVLLEPGSDLPEGGGTAFVPAFKLARTLKPDCIVHITDLETYDAEEAYGLASCPVVVAVDYPSQAENVPKGVEVVVL